MERQALGSRVVLARVRESTSQASMGIIRDIELPYIRTEEHVIQVKDFT